jgi:ferritin-like metal-binding protein YciE
MKQPGKKTSAATGLDRVGKEPAEQRPAGKQVTGKSGASSLERLFMAQLKDIYYVEKRLMELLPKIKEGCTTEELDNAFDLHIQQTEKQAKRLEKIFTILKHEPEAKRCEALEGLLEKNLFEEEETDHMLTQIAEGSINIEAEEEGSHSWQSNGRHNGM